MDAPVPFVSHLRIFSLINEPHFLPFLLLLLLLLLRLLRPPPTSSAGCALHFNQMPSPSMFPSPLRRIKAFLCLFYPLASSSTVFIFINEFSVGYFLKSLWCTLRWHSFNSWPFSTMIQWRLQSALSYFDPMVGSN